MNSLKRSLFVLIVGMFLVTTNADAQRPGGGQRPEGMEGFKGNISGKLTDESGKSPLEFATVAVYSQRDSSLVTGGITDATGSFSLDIRPGAFYVKAQFIGYGEKVVSDIRVNPQTPNVNLGSIVLTASELQLDEVTVQAERTEMELTLDRKVYNIGKDLSNLGGSASDLLGNLPSVNVDVDGNVTLRGSENVRILIDGKPSNLIGLSGSGGLQQLQGNLIERVEVITNPSARYDAEGGAGIINIILKKDKSKGFNGSFQVQTGYPANHGASINVNYRTGWINWFVNYGVTYRANPGRGYSNNSYLRPDTTFYIDQTNDRFGKGVSNNVRFGSDIYFNDKNILTLSASYRNSDDLNTTDVVYNYFDENQSRLGDRLRFETEDEADLNWQYSINYNRDFKRKGQKFTFDVQYEDSNEIELADFDDRTRLTNNNALLAQRSSNDNGEERVLVQADYTHPIGQLGKLETGFRFTYRNVFNDYYVESDSALDGNYERLDFLTNDFNFDENISAGYVILSNQKNNISWQLGTRLEHTEMKTLLEQTNERNVQNYLNLFPSAHFTYKFTDELSTQVSYSRRLSRPNFRHLNPFTSYSDPLNLYQGNPNLRPQFTDSYEIGLLTNKEKSTIYYGVYHRHTTNVVQRIQTESEGVSIRRPENLAVENAVGIEVNLTRDFTKAFRTSGNLNFYNSRTEGLGYYAEATTFTARWGNNYRNPKLFDAQVNVWYSAPQTTAQGKRLSMASVDAGLSRDVMKRNGTLSMNVRDLFNTRKYRGETRTPTFTSESLHQWRRGPFVVLSFTYRLNQSKQRQRREGGRDGEGFGGDDFGDFGGSK